MFTLRYLRPQLASRLHEVSSRLFAETAVTRLEISQGTQEIHTSEVGPQRLGHIELAVGALPEQKTAQALLSRGSDQKVRVGLTACIEVLGNQLGREDFGERIQALAGLGMRLDDRAHGIGDFFAATVRNSQVHVNAIDVFGARLRFDQGAQKLIWNRLAITNQLDAIAPLFG